MSYPPNQYPQYSQAPPQGQPPQGYPPQQGYPPASYPQNPYPPQPAGAGGYPPQQPGQPPYQGQPYGQQPPPPQQYQQQYQQHQYPPPQQGQPQHGYPPQPPYGQHPQHPQQPQQWGTPPPPGQYSAPPQGQYPPPGQYGAPPPQSHSPYPYGAPPPGAGYPTGAPPAPAPAPPSLGYDPDQRAPGDASKEADALRKAMKGWGTDEAALINTLAKPDPLQMALIRHTFRERIGRDLEKDIKSETSGDLETILLSLASGPLGQDIAYVHDALSGLGTDEKAINDALLGRSNADLRAIKYGYVSKYSKALVDDIRSDLSGKTEKFFVMLLNAARPEPGTYFDQASVDKDVHEVHVATQAKTGTDEVGLAAVFLGATDAKIVAIAKAFETKYHTPLEKVLRDELSGQLEQAIVGMLVRAQDPLKFDVETLLKVAPVGSPPDMKRLIYWVVRLHWNPPYFDQVKAALTKRTGGDFTRRIRANVVPGDIQTAILKVWG